MTDTALLLLSFGGPEKAEDVVPFLENVTRGRGIPRERLEEVGEHYFTLGGRSPINEQNRVIIRNLEAELAKRNLDIPVYFGNRNWEPYVEDAMQQAVKDGITHLYVFATSAWGGYSGCAQYQEDIRRGLEAVDHALTVERLPQFHARPEFVSMFAAAVNEARESLDSPDADLIFTAHSVPNKADDAAGPDGNLYSQQVLKTSQLVQQESSFAGTPGSAADFGWDTSGSVELTWQSRSGSPHVPWLEPDICDHIAGRASRGNKRGIVLCPIGFITDHIEVVWDLDTEAKQAAVEAGVPFVRAATPGLSPEFAAMVVDMMQEARHQAPLREDQQAAANFRDLGHTLNGRQCAPGCCEAPRTGVAGKVTK